MSERFFPFVQFELPWELGPADGRYVLRAHSGGEPEHVLVLSTLGAARRRLLGGASRRRVTRGRTVAPEPEPPPVPVARATVIDAVSVASEAQARAWLDQLDAEHATLDAVAVLNRALHAHRIAAADAYAREVSAAQALAIRAGWGAGEQVAFGKWSHARELRWREPHARRAAALRPQERFTRLLGANEQPLLCEELTLRARLDLDAQRVALAAVQLAGAYETALAELAREARPDLDERVQELRSLHADVEHAARAALAASGDAQRAAAEPLDEQRVRHALERLEAALRARTAPGWAG